MGHKTVSDEILECLRFFPFLFYEFIFISHFCDPAPSCLVLLCGHPSPKEDQRHKTHSGYQPTQWLHRLHAVCIVKQAVSLARRFSSPLQMWQFLTFIYYYIFWYFVLRKTGNVGQGMQQRFSIRINQTRFPDHWTTLKDAYSLVVSPCREFNHFAFIGHHSATSWHPSAQGV